MGDEARKGPGLETALEIWSRRKWLATAVFAACGAATLSLVAFLPDVYRATATVLVERQQVPEALVRASITTELETRLQTISQQILSRTRLQELIDRLDLYPDLRHRVPRETLVEAMRRSERSRAGRRTGRHDRVQPQLPGEGSRDRRPRREYAGVVLRRGGSEGPRAADDGDGGIPQAPARRGQAETGRAGSPRRRVQGSPQRRAAGAGRGQSGGAGAAQHAAPA